jgi:PAS domain S-box-containing protein
VLLVDDQPARLLTYESILSGVGVQCVRALSGVDALEKLLKQEFAVILLDVEMPGMDGFEVARLVREHPRMERTPIIFVTGVHVSQLDQLKGYEVGAIDYIAVPVVPEILRSKVALLVELHLRRKELKSVNESLQEARARLEAEHATAIADRDAQLQAAFEHPDTLTVVLRAARNSTGAVTDWIYVNANNIASKLLGLPRESLLGRKLSEVVPAERFERGLRVCNQVLDTGAPTRYENRFADRDLIITVFPAGPDTVISSGVDITERKLADQKLRESEAALKEADHRKDEFLAMLAHELRNPIAPISNAAEALSRLVEDDKARALVGMIQRQGAHFSRLLDDLLDVARITQGRVQLRREIISLSASVEHAIDAIQPHIKAKGHHLTVTKSSDPVHVSADKVRIEQCIANVLLNAVKYTDTGGRIRVKVGTDTDHAVVEISDTGVGIAPEFLPWVFDLFAQSERSIDRSQGGLGIGLAICRQLVEMHGGTVSATSAGLGQGATFAIRLPLLKEGVAATAGSAGTAASPRRVLIVDDNHDAADSLAMCLQLDGHRTLTVYSAESALQQAAGFDPHVVLLDIGLPGMDGYEVARRMRASKPSLRLIALSGYGQHEDKQRSVAAGFDAHLTKPVEMTALEALLRS